MAGALYDGSRHVARHDPGMRDEKRAGRLLPVSTRASMPSLVAENAAKSLASCSKSRSTRARRACRRFERRRRHRSPRSASGTDFLCPRATRRRRRSSRRHDQLGTHRRRRRSGTPVRQTCEHYCGRGFIRGQDRRGARRSLRWTSSSSSTRVSIGLPGSHSIVTVKRTGMSSRLLPSW
jgi:hypothetical protein